MINGRGKNSAYLLLFGSIASQSMAILSGKLAASSLNTNDILQMVTNVFFVLSLCCLVMQAFFWNLTLRRMELSVAYPSTSVVYSIILMIGYFGFDEKVTSYNIVGVIMMTIGVFFLNRKQVKE